MPSSLSEDPGASNQVGVENVLHGTTVFVEPHMLKGSQRGAAAAPFAERAELRHEENLAGGAVPAFARGSELQLSDVCSVAVMLNCYLSQHL